ncbi:MAG: hypothetical protein K6F35_11925 [Lachnospiraceae bacterium]|nr:hypothetical protein [Lachnospiraceae bacterium]
MIEFEEELKKFHPLLEVEEAERYIHNTDVTDLVDLMISLADRYEMREELMGE